jgi:hypothetical protein
MEQGEQRRKLIRAGCHINGKGASNKRYEGTTLFKWARSIMHRMRLQVNQCLGRQRYTFVVNFDWILQENKVNEQKLL